MAKYKVGDKVRVIRNGESGKTYYMENGNENNSMVNEMLEFCGKVVEISEITERGQYKIKELPGYWQWVDEMFEGLAEENTPKNLKEGDRVVIVSGGVWGNKTTIGETGEIVVVDVTCRLRYLVVFDNDVGGHSGDGLHEKCKEGHCFWCCDSETFDKKECCIEKIKDTDPFVISVNIPKNNYKKSCWHCRKGGIIDLLAFATDSVLRCPVCGRVCYGKESVQ